MSEQRVKRYVEVIADFQADGTLIPQAVVWDTGQRFDCGAARSIFDSAQIGLPDTCFFRKFLLRYTCQIGRTRTYLYYEVDRWFVEAKENAIAADPC